jgi:hypothetical protein
MPAMPVISTSFSVASAGELTAISESFMAFGLISGDRQWFTRRGALVPGPCIEESHTTTYCRSTGYGIGAWAVKE